jgi:hypothetical protein
VYCGESKRSAFVVPAHLQSSPSSSSVTFK